MDAQAKKALFRAKLREAEQKREKRIDSPLVRYNELEQPVCRVCTVALKSEAQWPAHQASRKHHEAIKNMKAAAAGAGISRVNDVEPDQSLIKSTDKRRLSSSLPTDFFDKQESKKPKTNPTAGSKVNPSSDKGVVPPVVSDPLQENDSVNRPEDLTSPVVEATKGRLENKCSTLPSNPSRKTNGSEVKPINGELPEGFFDNKDADLRARGIEPVKLDINDEYKEFEKVIQEDLQGVDERLEEEEFDAAEMIEEAETLEQKANKERVEMLKKKQMELKVVKFAREQKKPLKFRGEESSEESSDEEDEKSATIDWRAKHL
ncbi:protein ABA AND ROS SENSITIVE 1 [Aristolochia californica]|uniref:protein ABA AND ROS SENSITIVE 1 n=1 Tax=Aristolochia californica TaxID=171875 RepID=UPI0035DF805F